MITYLDTIARFAAETRYDDIPADAIEATKWILLDTLGGMLAGSTLPEVASFAALARERSAGAACTLVGFAGGADGQWAAMLNSTSACSYETDEGNRLGGGHPAIHVVPPALAAAEVARASGRELLATVAVAYEVMSRLAVGGPARWPVHSHGTHGSPGAAVAAGRPRGLDAATMRRVINLAACMTPATTWQVCFEGGIVRNVFSAESCFLGMLAVDLEACGYRGAADGPAEMYGAVLGDGAYDRDAVVAGLGEEWRVTANYFKPYASCRITHAPLDGIYAILGDRALMPAEIESIEVRGPAIATHLGYDDPPNMLSAKFSIPYGVAAAIVLGHTNLDAFTGDALADPAIRALAARVTVTEDSTLARRRADAPWGRVVVRLRDGSTLRAETGVPSGDALNPLSRDDLRAKFRTLAGMRCDRRAADALYHAVMEIDQIDDVRHLHALLSAAGEAAAI